MTIMGVLASCTGWGLVQYETASDVPQQLFKERASIHALVEKITDGDTVKVRHLASSNSRIYDGTMKDHTIIVRIAAVDTPETAKRGQAGQAYSVDAMAFTEKCLKGKEVQVKLLSRDQYGRVIGRIQYTETYFFGMFKKKRDISEELLKAGLAVVYRQGGAQYDGSIEHWSALEKAAIQKGHGMWKHGKERVELPSEHKKKAKSEGRERVAAQARGNAL